MNTTQLRIALVVAVIAIATVAIPSALAKSNGDNRPGWGFGDKNHSHVGPPGSSVRPDRNERIVQRLEKKEDKIINRLENNNKIPEPQKTNLINDIRSLFDKLISYFS